MAMQAALSKPKLQRATAPARAPTPWSWALLGSFWGGLLMVLAFFPAQWLAQAVAMATQDHLQLQEARGTLWQGSARVVLTGGAGSRDAQALPGRINWTLETKGLGGQLGLTSSCCMPQSLLLHITPEWGGASLHMTDTPSTWPAALLSGLGAPWNTLQPEGDLTLAPKQLRLQWLSGRLLVQGGLTLTATDTASRLTQLKPMGTDQLQLDAGAKTKEKQGTKLTKGTGSRQWSGKGKMVGTGLGVQHEGREGREK